MEENGAKKQGIEDHRFKLPSYGFDSDL